jgi:DNA-binding MarR family transcriptional regulator
MRWLYRAAFLPGKALHLAVALRHLAGIVGSNDIQLSRKLLEQMCISPDACSDGLRRMEAAGLISVKRHPGRRPRICIIEVY